MDFKKTFRQSVLFAGLVLLFGWFPLLYGCKSNQKERAGDFTRAFYYWQTSLSDFNFEDSTFLSLKVSKLYIRFFDVDWDEQTRRPVPVSPLELGYQLWPDTTQIVPVVFITNETFGHLNMVQAKELAHSVHKKVMARISQLASYDWYRSQDNRWWEQNPYQVKTKDFREQAKKDSVYRQSLKHYEEIQFDCDWTAATREKYFAFLREYKALFPGKTISATIRLYPYKYPEKAGVPPVTRGMLMCYNAGNIRKAETKNSLFDKQEVLSYLEDAKDYPLPLDYALPMFHWGVLFSQGKFANILPLADLSRYARHLSIKDSLYYQDDRPGQVVTVTEDFVLGDGYQSPYLRRGDKIRIEKAPMKDVLELAGHLAKERQPGATLSLFHLNEYDLTQHSKEIRRVFDSF